MDLMQLYTKRSISGQNYAQPIIYEWEDVIAKELDIPVVHYPPFCRSTNKLGTHKILILEFISHHVIMTPIVLYRLFLGNK